MNQRDSTFVATSATVDASSAVVAAPGETAQPRMSSKLRTSGSTKPPGLNEAIEAPLTPLPSAMLLSPGASAAGDALQYDGYAPHARTATATAVVATANAAPLATIDRGVGREDSGILRKEDDNSRKVGVVLVKGSLQPFARATSEAAKHCSGDAGSDGTEGGLPRCGGRATAASATSPCRASCASQTTPELFQRDDLLFAAAAAAAATATDVRQSPVTPPPPDGACSACDDMANPLHSRCCGGRHTETHTPDMGESDRPQSGCAASSASSAPHSTAETQWHNTSEASEPDLHEAMSPVTGVSTDGLTAIAAVATSSALGRSASSATISERPAGPAPTADLDAKGRSPISVSEAMSPFQRNTTGLQQSAKPSDWRHKRVGDKLAIQLEGSSSDCGGHGDASLVSLENTVTGSAGKPNGDSSPSPAALLSLQRRRVLDSNVCTRMSTEVRTATTRVMVMSGSVSHLSSSHCSRRALDSHPATERGSSITTICGPHQAATPLPQLSPPVCPDGAVVASASLSASARSALGMPVLMSGSTASLAFPKCATTFPIRATPDAIANSVGDESAQQSPRRHDERDKRDSHRPLLPSTAPVVAPAVQHVSSLISAAWPKSPNESPVTFSKQQQQEQVQLAPFRRPKYGEANTSDSDSSDSPSAPPQKSLRSFTVTSTTSFCAEHAAAACSPRRKTAEHSSLHDSAMSLWQSSTTSEDRILQTFAHGMALGGVPTGPWKTAQDNSAPPPSNSPVTELHDRCLTEKPLAPQRFLLRSSRLAASCATGSESNIYHSPWNCTSLPWGPSLLVPTMHGTDMSRSLGSGTRAPCSCGKSPTAALASSPTRFSEPQSKLGRLGGMSSMQPAEARGTRPMQVRSPVSMSAPSKGNEAADAISHSLASSPPTAAQPSPSKRRTKAQTPKRLQQRRERPNSGYFFTVANNSSLRSAGGSAAAAPPAFAGSAHHAERSLVTPMRGYSFMQQSATASVASSALSQVPFVVEGVISVGSTPCIASCVEAAVATQLRVASTDTAARQPSGDRTVMLRSNDSSAPHYRMPSSCFLSAADSSIAIEVPMEALLEERLTFLQSVHDAGGFAAQAASSASLGCTTAVQSLLAGETAGPAAVTTLTVSLPSHRLSPMPGPIPSAGLVSRRMRRITAGGVPKAPSFDPTGTAASSPAMAAAAPSGISIKSPDKASEWLSTKLTAVRSIGVASDSVATEPIALMGERSSVCAPPPPKSAMLFRPSLTQRPSYRIHDSEAVATMQLMEELSMRNNVSERPGDSTSSVFLPVLPLAPDEKAAASFIYEVGPVRAMSPMPASPEADDPVAVAPLRAADTDHRSTPTYGSSGESGTHSSSMSISCRSPPGILPPQQQRTCCSHPKLGKKVIE